MTAYDEAVALVDRAAALGLEWYVSKPTGRIRSVPSGHCVLTALGLWTGFLDTEPKRLVVRSGDGLTDASPALRAYMLKRLVGTGGDQ